MKYLKNFILFLIPSMFISISHADSDFESKDYYDKAKVLSRCAGDFEFQSVVSGIQGNDKSIVKLLHEHANGWFTAGMANYYFSGLTREAAKISAQGDKETRETALASGLATIDPKNPDQLGKYLLETLDKVKYCSSLDPYVVESQKKLKKAWMSR